MKQHMNKALLSTLLFSLTYMNGWTQQLDGTNADQKLLPGTSASAPMATGMSDLYNLNLYDGSATINIPIYKYNTDQGDFGISFSYNTKGVLVDEQSSRLGLHWMMNAFGRIQRVVRDVPDELVITPDYQADGYTPFSKILGRFAASFPPTNPNLLKRYLDKESDDFMVSIGNLNFTFQMGKQRAIHTIPEKNVQIEILTGGIPVADYVQNTGTYPDYNTFEFRITDETGNQYYFINGDRKTNRFDGEYYRDLPMLSRPITGSYQTTMNWVIREVVLNTGARILYNYHPVELKSPEYLFHSFQTLEGAPIGGQYVKGYDYEIVLKDIDYPNGVTASFVYDSTGRCDAISSSNYYYNALREIVVTEQGNCLRYLLQQSYFKTPYEGNPQKELPYGAPCDSEGAVYAPGQGASYSLSQRLKLNGIMISSCDKSYQEPYYSFVYDTTAVPARFNGGQDYFGYYNGKKATIYSPSTPVDSDQGKYEQTMNIPKHKNSEYGGAVYGLDKTSDISKMQMGILKQVNNAQGGSIVFEYEGHVLANVATGYTLPVDSFFGASANDGLRLWTITEKDKYNPSALVNTTMVYEQGQRFLAGGYYHYPVLMAAATGDLATSIIFGDYNLTAHHLVAGSNHGYGKVTVTTSNESAEILAKRVYTFTNYKDASSGNQARYLKSNGSKHYFEFPYTDKQYLRDWEMGLPLTITDYDPNGRLLQQTINTYTFSLVDSTASLTAQVINEKIARVEYVGAPIIDTHQYINGSTYMQALVPAKRNITDAYRPYRGKAQLDRLVVLKYVADTRYIADTSWYSYDHKSNLKDIITLNSDGSKVRTRNVYNYDAPATSGTELYQMNQSGIEKLVSTERWLMGTGAHHTDKLLEAGIYSFNFQGGKLWSRNLYTLAAGSPLSYSAYTGITGGPGIPDPHQKIISAFNGSAISKLKKVSDVILFDSKGNPLENKLQDQNRYKAMIWDTTTGNRKLAEAENARYTDIAYNSFEYNAPGPGGALFVHRGNISYDVSKVVTTQGSISGRYAYRLVSGGQTLNGTQNLQSGKEYLLSFWTKGSLPKVYLGATQVTLPGTAAYTHSSNGWKQYILRLTGTGSVFKIDLPASGTSYIDEVRLQPADALMQSNTYEPLFGISSATDATGRITYYEYDALGRQSLIRDQEGNILSRTKQVVQGPQ